MTIRHLGPTDRLLAAAQRAVTVLAGETPVARAFPADGVDDARALSPAEKRLSGALMRVNHVGEVCAQALYEGQALSAESEALRARFREAASEEREHLAWTAARLDELGDRPSLLNPLWYAGAFLLGALAGRAGDRASLGFMAETEDQVERHLDSHLERLPEADRRSRVIVAQMKQDEARHASTARQMGGARLPWPARQAMKLSARVMTGTAHWL